jgi:hypothetical protein
MFSVLHNCITIDCGKNNAALSTSKSTKKGTKEEKGSSNRREEGSGILASLNSPVLLELHEKS